MGNCIENAGEMDYQWDQPLDIWSGALWLGAALKAMVKLAAQGDADAMLWVDRTPDQVKARWPGVFPEFPYDGEPLEEHAQRQAAQPDG